MLIRNTSRRLITINTGNDLKTRTNLKTGEKEVLKVTALKHYDLMPAGPFVHVPEPFCSNPFIKALKAEGSVETKPDEVEEPESDDDGNDDGDANLSKMTKDELIAYGSMMELDLDPATKKADMITAIEKAQSSTD